MNRVDVWDGWRGLAILFVLIGHFANIEWLWEDRFGVDIFFVLSGMLMSKILFEQRIKLKRFYIRRFSRIFPVFLAYILVIYSLAALAKFEFSSLEVLSTVTFLRSYLPAEPHIFNTNIAIGHLWSLNVEEHAYVIMSVLTLMFLSIQRAAYALLACGAAAIAVSFYYSSSGLAGQYFYIRTECAISFVFLSAGYSLLRTKHGWQGTAWLAPSCFVLALCCYIDAAPRWLTWSAAPVFLAVAANHLTNAASPIQSLLCWRPLQLLGLYSYSIYLWQQPLYMYHQLLPGGLLTGLLLALLAGYLSFRFFEDPVRQWINTRWGS